MDAATRTRLVALAVLLAVCVPLLVIAAAGGGSDKGTGLRVQPSFQGLPSVVIYLEDADVNEPDTNHGRRRVTVECLDEAGEVVFSGRRRWPFRDTDGGIYNPHVHMVVDPPALLDRIVRCRLKGTDPPLEGRKA